MRTITSYSRNEFQAPESGEIFLWFATITHTGLPTPIRVVTEGNGAVSYRNGEIVNYRLAGALFLGCPFALDWISDNDQMPRGQVIMPDPQRRIGLEILKLTESPRFKMELYREVDWAYSYDGTNARVPTGTPTREALADFLYLRNITGDALSVQADLTVVDFNQEPWPYIRATADRLNWITK